MSFRRIDNKFWAGHLEKMLENDESPEMRRLVIRAAGRLDDPSAMAMIERDWMIPV